MTRRDESRERGGGMTRRDTSEKTGGVEGTPAPASSSPASSPPSVSPPTSGNAIKLICATFHLSSVVIHIYLTKASSGLKYLSNYDPLFDQS